MRTRRVLRESNEALTEGFGPENQRECCQKFEEKQGLQVAKEHLSVESSSTWRRDELDDIITEAIREKDDIPCIEFPRVNRFARNLEAACYYFGLLRKNGLVVAFAFEEHIIDDHTSPMKALQLLIDAYQADQDGRIMKHSMLNARDKLVKVEQVPNGTVIWPFDYQPKEVYGQMTTGKPSVNEQRAAWVRTWAKSILEEGFGLNTVAKWMAGEKVQTKRGKKITPKMVDHILRSRQLLGEFRWKGELYLKDEKLRILADEVFEALQKRLDENRARSYYNAVKWDYPPLPDVFHRCGERMKRAPFARRNGKKIGYYRCRKCKGRGSCIKAQPVWDWLRPKIELELLREERLIPAISAEFNRKDTLERLEREIKAKDAQIQKWDETKDTAFTLGTTLKNYPVERVQEQIDKAEDKIQYLTVEKSVLENQLATVKEQRMNVEGIRRLCQMVSGNLAKLSKDQWKILLKRLGLRVIIDSKEDITVKVALPPIRESEIEFTRFR